MRKKYSEIREEKRFGIGRKEIDHPRSRILFSWGGRFNQLAAIKLNKHSFIPPIRELFNFLFARNNDAKFFSIEFA